MFLSAGLAPLVMLAMGLVADPSLALASHYLLTVPISRHVDFNGISDFTKKDREHLRNLVKRGRHRRQSSTVNKVANIPLNNTGGIYVATIGVGTPPTSCGSCIFLPSMVSYILA